MFWNSSPKYFKCPSKSRHADIVPTTNVDESRIVDIDVISENISIVTDEIKYGIEFVTYSTSKVLVESPSLLEEVSL